MAVCGEWQDSGALVDGQRCSWIMTEAMGRTHGMHGTLEAELEVQRTVQSANGFLCLLRKAIGPTMVHVDNKGRAFDGGENEVHWPESEGRRLVDLDLGRSAQISSRRG